LADKRKTSGPTWSELKAEVVKLDEKELVHLIADLYRLSSDNKAFLNARFSIGSDPLGPYRKTIEECMYPDVISGNQPIQVAKAKRAISSYSKAVGDPLGEAELMIFFVECGNSFTVNFGDIDGAFYDALIGMYRRAIDKVLLLPEEQRNDFKDRLETIMTSASGIGWGYYDALCDDFYTAFPEDG